VAKGRIAANLMLSPSDAQSLAAVASPVGGCYLGVLRIIFGIGILFVVLALRLTSEEIELTRQRIVADARKLHGFG
jgi:hypothetical protein